MSRYASDYVQEFEKPMIVMQGLMIEPSFVLSSRGFFLNAPANFIASGEPYLLGILNSKLLWFFHSNLTISVQQGFLRIYVYNVEKFPIAKPREAQRRAIEERVEKILAAKNPSTPSRQKSGGTALRVTSVDTSALEGEIDEIVYELYGLNEDDIKEVETWYRRRYPKLAKAQNKENDK